MKATTINDLCEPLFEKTPIKFFSYFGFDLEKDVFVKCCTRPEVQEARLKLEYPMWALILDSGYYWYDDFEWVNVSQFYKRMNCYNFLTVIKHTQHLAESFNFATGPDEHGMINFYMNNLGLIDNFIQSLKTEGAEYFSELNTKAEPIFEYFKFPPEHIDSEFRELNKPYLTNRFYDKDRDMWIELSDRERQVLYLFAIEGQTSKQIGESLNISPKTVENHLDKLRIKLDAKTSKLLLVRAVEIGMIKLKTHF